MVDAPPIVHGYFDKKYRIERWPNVNINSLQLLELNVGFNSFEFDIFQKEYS